MKPNFYFNNLKLIKFTSNGTEEFYIKRDTNINLQDNNIYLLKLNNKLLPFPIKKHKIIFSDDYPFCIVSEEFNFPKVDKFIISNNEKLIQTSNFSLPYDNYLFVAITFDSKTITNCPLLITLRDNNMNVYDFNSYIININQKDNLLVIKFNLNSLNLQQRKYYVDLLISGRKVFSREISILLNNIYNFKTSCVKNYR
ncbi:hypothetical protein XO10_05490 [Marinitoga sp. 1135]|uniref:hypothetical protein n=1 Tax=unclassified Marinitoga TaxID=2640159 RepID=UPI0015863945|nr:MULTISPECIES: hypothetical protein [unclassified Marinitoga]NUU95727.1 hypothetical protein [Marinitoga sp. 1135]NUU97659.1 hypothetical protein [Marinitoga sp. 1138]